MLFQPQNNLCSNEMTAYLSGETFVRIGLFKVSAILLFLNKKNNKMKRSKIKQFKCQPIASFINNNKYSAFTLYSSFLEFVLL